MLLAGDIGGTKTLLGLFSAERHTEPPLFLRSYPSREHTSLESILSLFMEEIAPFSPPGFRIDSAAFGVAGPVISGLCRTTNLPWVVDTKSLESLLSLPKGAVGLVNDLVAIAWGSTVASPETLMTVNEGIPDSEGTRVVVAPGTGLGEAIIGFSGGTPIVLATEGGHVDWAPPTPDDVPLLEWLWTAFGHASPERLLSGPGIALLYRFHLQSIPPHEHPLPPETPEENIPEAVSKEAARGNPLARKIIDHFWRLLAAEAGNMALKALSTGGVVLSGGIPEKIAQFLDCKAFMESFSSKGRYRDLLLKVPVLLASDPEIGIKGATAIARSIRQQPKNERSPL